MAPTIERIEIADIPGWDEATKPSFQSQFREIAKALADAPVESPIRVPIVELTKSALRGQKLARSLKSALQKHKEEFGIGKGAEMLLVRCDNEYAYFMRHVFAADADQRRSGKKAC